MRWNITCVLSSLTGCNISHVTGPNIQRIPVTRPLTDIQYIRMMGSVTDNGLINDFYPRPVLAFGYCCCPCIYVFVSACQWRICLRDKLSSVEARTAKFGQNVKHIDWDHYCFESWLILIFKEKFNFKSKFHCARFIRQSKYTTTKINTNHLWLNSILALLSKA